MLKNLIAIAIAAMFTSAAFAQSAPAAPSTPAKPVEAVKQVAITPAAAATPAAAVVVEEPKPDEADAGPSAPAEDAGEHAAATADGGAT